MLVASARRAAVAAAFAAVIALSLPLDAAVRPPRLEYTTTTLSNGMRVK